MKKPTQPFLILLPGEPDEFMSFECSKCGQLFLTDSEYTDWDLMDDFARHLRVMHKGQYSLPITYEVRLAKEKLITLVYLTTRSPSKLGDELILAGYRVFEALAISEVLYLQEHEHIDAVVIDASVEQQEEKGRQLRGTILKLNPKATPAYVQWELSLLFPNRDRSLQ